MITERKTLKKILILLFVHFVCFETLGQNNFCYSFVKDSKPIDEIILSPTQEEDTILENIKIGLSIFSFNEFGNEQLEKDTIESYIDYLNKSFEGAKISFFLLGDIHNIHSERLFYFDVEENSIDHTEIDNRYAIQGTINIYFVGPVSIGNQLPIGWCGMAYFPEDKKDKIILSKFCATKELLVHEMGHFFSLYHTHETFFGKELVNGSNCSTSGDKICDTPADPGLNSRNTNESCKYTGTTRDDSGAYYTPAVNNFMAYSRDACRNTFTNDQMKKVQDAYKMYKTHLITQPVLAAFEIEKSHYCIGQEVKFLNKSIGGNKFDWKFSGAKNYFSTVKKPKIIFEEAGFYDVELTVTDTLGNSNSYKNENFVFIESEDSTFNDFLSGGNFEDSLLLERVINKDESMTFELNTNVASKGDQSVWINFFDYEYSSGEIDYLLLGEVNNFENQWCNFSFDYAYTSYDSLSYDHLSLVYRERCNDNWKTLWSKSGIELQTSNSLNNKIFVPKENEWKSISVPLFLNTNTSFIEFAFKTESGWGNALYIDNYKLTSTPQKPIIQHFENKLFIQNNYDSIQWFQDGILINSNNETILNLSDIGTYTAKVKKGKCDIESAPILIEQIITSFNNLDYQITFFPNPTNGMIVFDAPSQYFNASENHVTLLDLNGRELLSKRFTKNLNLNGVTPGIYFLIINLDGEKFIKRLILK